MFPPPFRRHSDARQYHSQRRHSDARGFPGRRFPAPPGPGRGAPPHSGGFGGGGGYQGPSIGYWGGAPGAGAAGTQPPPSGVRSRAGAGSSLSPAPPHGVSFPRRTSLQESVLEVSAGAQ